VKGFSRWQTIDACDERGAGVFQIKIERGLVEYPRGKSAMIYYGAGPNVREAVQAVASRLAEQFGPIVCRSLASDQFEEELAHHLQRFTDQFGAPPEGHNDPEPN
jgi:hypothetical protein